MLLILYKYWNSLRFTYSNDFSYLLGLLKVAYIEPALKIQ